MTIVPTSVDDDPELVADGSVGAPTEKIEVGGQPQESVRRFRLVVPDEHGAPITWDSTGDRCSIGSHGSNDLIVEDPSVSRFHCELRIDARGVRARDLGSRNGTLLDGIPIVEAWLRNGSTLRLGRRVVQFQLGAETVALPLSTRSQFGALVGGSVAMRGMFAVLELAAGSDATVLLEGETGTGKEATAESLHQASRRKSGPLVVVDCAAVPANLLESQLFGHERGAFTGAVARRTGAFEEASRGTIFLDEIGELPAELQPKLLRVLERREVQPVGATGYRAVDVRIIAATNRDLRAEVNLGRFRPDLYFRLAVVKIAIPSLRQRPEDIPALVDHLLASLGADAGVAPELRAPDFLRALQAAAWPGNVRELRNYIERCLVFRQPLPVASSRTPTSAAQFSGVRYDEARRRVLEGFERAYVEQLLGNHGGNVSAAARAAGIGRVYLYRLMNRHGLR